MLIRSLLRKLTYRFILPLCVLGVACIAAQFEKKLAKAAPAFVEYSPYVIFAIGFLLSWGFNRSRAFFALLVLGAVDQALRKAAGGGDSSFIGDAVYRAAIILIPVNFIWFSLISERGILSGRGILRFCIILVQAALATALCLIWPEPVLMILSFQFDSAGISETLILSHGAQTVFLIAFVCLGLRLVSSPGSIDIGLFWALAGAAAALQIGSGFLFSAAGLLLIVSIIAASHSMAFRDELTGLPARRSMDDALRSLGGQYAIAMLDIDRFKKFNDTYGHLVGDQVLKMVASRISAVSGGGKPFRYGGEEFAVVFNGRTREDAVPHLDKVRKAIQATGFSVRGKGRPRRKPKSGKPRKNAGKKVTVTISVGVADSRKKNTTPHEVIKAADKALYKAKRGGRNRTCV